MGYDFALQDKKMNQDQGYLDSIVYDIKDVKPKSEEESLKLKERLQGVKEKLLPLTRKRFELINSRREMGYRPWDIEKLVEEEEKAFELPD